MSDMLDLKIEGAHGRSTAPARRGAGPTWAFAARRIAAIGDLSPRVGRARAQRLRPRLAPGFIDMHSHSDWRLWGNRRAESKIRQGVTTEVVGNCGFSPAPIHGGVPRRHARLRPLHPERAWTSRGARSASTCAPSTAAAPRSTSSSSSATAPCGSPRWASRAAPPTAAELTADAADAGRRDGGRRVGALHRPHLRARLLRDDRGDRRGRPRRPCASAASTRATSAARAPRCSTPCARRSASGVRPTCRCRSATSRPSGRPNWGKVADALALIDAARAEGLDVMADVYPYTASSTSLRTLLPDWVLEGGVDAMLKRLEDAAARGRIRRELEAPVDRPEPARPHRLGEHHDRLLREPEGRRGPATLRDRRRPRARSARRRLRAAARRRRQGLDDPVPARRGATCAGRWCIRTS